MRKTFAVGVAIIFMSLFFGAMSAPAWADGTQTIIDPADLHIGTGAGTACATGCGLDPNVINPTGFDIYYNPNPNSSQSPIGNPFDLIVAVPIYTGSSTTNSVNSPALWYSPYPGGTPTNVTIGAQVDNGELTSGPIYQFLFPGLTANKSFSFVNMAGCDTGTSCTNSGLLGSSAPLFGQTITGFEIFTYAIGTSGFAPGDLLDFTGNLPIGSYVSAVGMVCSASSCTAWDVPFTESGLVANTPEPATFVLLAFGLVAVFAFRRRLGFVQTI